MISPVRLTCALSLAWVALVWTGVLGAQEQRRQPGATQPGATQPAATQPGATQRFSAVPQANQHALHTDAQLAAWLVVDNQNEIALANMAQERAKNDDVKDFARKARDDHEQLLSKLQQFVGGMAGGAPQQTNVGNNAQNEAVVGQAPNANNPQARQPGQAAGVAAPVAPPQQQQHMAGGINFVALKRELGAQCRQTAQQELGQKNGSEFDECFLGMQIGVHHQAIDTMMVFRNHASPGLQKALDEGIQVAQGHLKHAKELMKEVTSKDSSKTSSTRRESTTESR